MLARLNRRAKGLDYWDLKMASGGALCFGIILSRLVPALVDVNPWWWVALAVLLLLRPLYHFWVRPAAS
jgi:hypothetical protein